MNDDLLIANCVKSEGMNYLSEALKVNSTLTYLSLAGTHLNASMCIVFISEMNDYIRIVNKLRDECMKHLCEALKVNFSLNQLNLNSTQ